MQFSIKNSLFILSILFVSMLFPKNGAAQEVSSKLTKAEIRIGEQSQLVWELRVPATAKNLNLPPFNDTLVKLVDIVNVGEVDTTFDEEDISTKIFTQAITITSWDTGFHAIPPMRFVVDGKEMFSSPLLISVETVELKEEDIKDIKPIIDVPFSLSDWVAHNKSYLALVLLVIALVIIGIYLLKRYKNREKEIPTVVVPKEEADVVALKKLEELLAKQYWQAGKVKLYYSELTFILREYLENRFQMRALELTTDETITLCKINKVSESKEIEEMRSVLELADFVKFAKQQTLASENENAFNFVKKFIIDTKLEIANTVENEETKVEGND